MTFLRISRTLSVAAAALFVASATACVDEKSPLSPAVAPALSVQAQLQLSTIAAEPGERIAVSLDVQSGGILQGQQGLVRYNGAALRYVGQDAPAGTWFIVNDKEPNQLQILSYAQDGLGRSAGTMVFEVLHRNYVQGLAYEFGMASTLTNGVTTDISSAAVQPMGVAGDVPAAATRKDVFDHLLAAYEADLAAGRPARKPSRALLVPGEFRLNLQYGDADLSGAVTLGDAILVANAAVGNNELITGTDAPARDYAIAANVQPFNVGLTRPAGTEASGVRQILLNDAIAIANGAILNNQPIVRTVIPGRASAPGSVARAIITGDITADRTFFRDSVYELAQIIRVRNGATLTVQAGTRIEGRSGVTQLPCAEFFTIAQGGTGTNVRSSTNRPPTCNAGVVDQYEGFETYPSLSEVSALFIERDGYIIANGSQSDPIVMTCTAATKTKGCWGGLSIAGNAPVTYTTLPVATQISPVVAGRSTGGCLQNQAEGGGPIFGGCNPADSSGVLRYVRVEFGGYLLSLNNELNNVTLNGVGHGTDIEYVQAHGGLDDGIELFGGTVDLKYIVMTDNSDDSFDYSQGWAGRAQFGIVSMDPADGDKGFEVDNSEISGEFGRTSPWGTIGEVWNFTMVGRYGAVSGNTVQDAMHIRRGAHTIQRNLLVWSWPVALDLDDTQTCAADAQTNNVQVANSYFGRIWGGGATTTATGVLGNSDGSDPAGCGVEGAYLRLAANSNVVADSADAAVNPFFGASAATSSALNRTLPDFRPRSTFSMTGAAAPAAVRDANPAAALTPHDGGAAQTGTVTGLNRPSGFFDATATYFGGVAPATATKNNIPWYSGWTRGS